MFNSLFRDALLSNCRTTKMLYCQVVPLVCAKPNSCENPKSIDKPRQPGLLFARNARIALPPSPLMSQLSALAKGLLLLAAAMLALPTALAAGKLAAQDVTALAGTCFNCHGPNGRSTGAIPSLQGQPPNRLLMLMQSFKNGEQANATVMTRLMKGYDDDQIQALAQWFSARETK